jgi:tripartite-type tricarboxylate transporter receptor subunit TctC
MIEGGVPGYEASAWVGLMAPAGVPKELVDKLQQSLAQSLRDPAIVTRINGMGVVPGGQSPGRVRGVHGGRARALQEAGRRDRP